MTDAATTALSADCDGPVLVHSDIRGVLAQLDGDVKQAVKDPSCYDDLMSRVVRRLQHAVGDRHLWIPAYNYDFCTTGLYDVRYARAQIGALPEFFRTRKAEWRSDTPVFSITGTGREAASIPGALVDPFGSGSEFHQLCERRGLLLFYGVPFSPTHTHYVERTSNLAGPLYRYDKLFKGTIRYSDVHERAVTLKYHVAPRGVLVRYDMPRLKRELQDAGILRPLPPQFGRSYVAAASELTAFWRQQLLSDPFYFMDPSCRSELDRLVRLKGGRLDIADFDDKDFDPADTCAPEAVA